MAFFFRCCHISALSFGVSVVKSVQKEKFHCNKIYHNDCEHGYITRSLLHVRVCVCVLDNIALEHAQQEILIKLYRVLLFRFDYVFLSFFLFHSLCFSRSFSISFENGIFIFIFVFATRRMNFSLFNTIFFSLYDYRDNKTRYVAEKTNAVYFAQRKGIHS